MSEPKYDEVRLTTSDLTTSRAMLGRSVSDLNAGVSQSQMSLLLPAVPMTSLPAITATVYYKKIALNPQPNVLFELSCGSNVATIDQSGVIHRQSNPNALSFDSNGCVNGDSNGGIGSLVQVSGTVLRADGSQSGCRGVLNVTIQNSAAKQRLRGISELSDGTPLAQADSSPSSSNEFYNLVK